MSNWEWIFMIQSDLPRAITSLYRDYRCHLTYSDHHQDSVLGLLTIYPCAQIIAISLLKRRCTRVLIGTSRISRYLESL